MLTTDQLTHLGQQIINLVESVNVALQEEPKYGDIYLDLNVEHLEKIKEDLMSIHRNVVRLRREVSSHVQKS